MTFAHSDEQRMLADAIVNSLASTDALSWGDAVTALGLDHLGIREAEGGMGTDLRDAAVVAAAFGRVNAGLPWAEHWTATVLGGSSKEGSVASDEAGVLRLSNDATAQEQARDHLALLHSAEMVGLCRTLMTDTATYLNQRHQFGVAIATFQVLRHRMADMAMALELAEAQVDLAIDTQGADRARAVSAGRVLAGEAARLVGEGAVQLHGAMGLTAELRVGEYFRRLRTLMQGDGSAAAHVRRYAA